MINFKEYDDRTDQYVADEIKKRRLAKQVVNATDDYKMKKTKPAFTFPHHTGSTTIHVYLRKMSSGVVAYNYDLKFDEGSHQRKVAQDDDVEDREGTQPAKYYKGVKSKSTKQARARHFEKGVKMDDDNPAAYKPAPGDKSDKTKPSKHTLKYKQMSGENKSDKPMMMKLTTKAMKAIPNSPDQKELIKQVNVYRKKLGMKPMKEETVNEKKGSDYDLYHKTFSGAMQHAYAQAKKRGYVVDKDDIDNKVATGPR